METWHINDRLFTEYTRAQVDRVSKKDELAKENARKLQHLVALADAAGGSDWDPRMSHPEPERRYRCDDVLCDFQAAPPRTGSGSAPPAT